MYGSWRPSWTGVVRDPEGARRSFLTSEWLREQLRSAQQQPQLAGRAHPAGSHGAPRVDAPGGEVEPRVKAAAEGEVRSLNPPRRGCRRAVVDPQVPGLGVGEVPLD